MNILVCIKQVPDTTEIKINPETNTLMREGVPSIVNTFDAYALELGVRLKEKHGGKVTVMSMGPDQAKAALKECLSAVSYTHLIIAVGYSYFGYIGIFLVIIPSLTYCRMRNKKHAKEKLENN